MIKRSIFLSFPPKLFIIMVNIIILNSIDYFKVDVDNTFFSLRPIFYLKISLIGDFLA
jgi:hypothetical protein